LENKKNRVIEVIGRDPAGMYFKIVPHAKKELKKNKILNVPGGIFSLSLSLLPTLSDAAWKKSGKFLM